MSVIPRTDAEKIAFFSSHIAPWMAHATAIGTTTSDITAFETKNDAAIAALAQQVAARNAAKAATLTAQQAMRAVTRACADVLKQIKTKAATAGDEVYALAEIAAPQPPSPAPAPGVPTDFKIELLPGGALKLTWTCANPVGIAGPVYQITRRIGSGATTFLGLSGKREFTDETVPAGTSQIVYEITGVRTTVSGPKGIFLVLIGAGGSGMTVQQLAEAPRMAA